MTQNRTKRNDARAARNDEQERAAVIRVPDEVAADRPAQLEPVTGPQLLGQVRGDLTVVQALDRDRHRLSRSGGNRVPRSAR